MAGETVVARALQHRVFALFRAARAIAITSSRILAVQRGLLGGFKMADMQWKDLKDVRLDAEHPGRASAAPTSPSTACSPGHPGIAVDGVPSEAAAGHVRQGPVRGAGLGGEAPGPRPGGDPRGLRRGHHRRRRRRPAAASGDRMVEEIRKAKALLDEGAVSDAEFQEMKAKILGRAAPDGIEFRLAVRLWRGSAEGIPCVDGRPSWPASRPMSAASAVQAQPDDGRAQRPPSPRSARPRSASFSPDGTQVAYISNASGSPQVWVVPAAGGAPVQVTRLPDPVQSVAWSPTGDRLAYEVAPGGGLNVQVYVARADGSDAKLVTAGGEVNNRLYGWTPRRPLAGDRHQPLQPHRDGRLPARSRHRRDQGRGHRQGPRRHHRRQP